MKIIKDIYMVSVKLPNEYGSVQITNGVEVEFDDVNTHEDESAFLTLKKQIEDDTIEEVKQLKNKVNATKTNNVSLKLG